MTTATVTTKTVKKTIEVEEEQVTLTMSRDVALAVMATVGKCNGNAHQDSNHDDSVYWVLYKALGAIPAWRHKETGGYLSTIPLIEYELEVIEDE